MPRKAKDPVQEINERVEEVVKRKRAQRPFPACAFEEALQFAKSVHAYGSGKPVRRLSVFDHLGKAPDSGHSRMLIVNANKYGLLKGNYSADQLELTQDGLRSVDDDMPKREKAKAWLKLAITDIEPFSKLFERFSGAKLPARAALVDAIQEFDVPQELAEEAVDTFVVNLRFVGLLRTLSGAERVVTVDHLLDSLPSSAIASTSVVPPATAAPPSRSTSALVTAEHAEFSSICFYIAPIGEDGSEQRKHSDLFLGSIVEPALEHLGLRVVRADAIDKPGTITRQVIEYLLRARLVIADLSFHNPNVFYELAIRHAARLPVVQLVRAGDRVPFDLNQMRTIKIDTSDIYSLVPKIDTYRAEIGNQARRALEDPDSVDNPITTYFPDVKMLLAV